MITIHKEFDLPIEYDLSRIDDPEKLLFFDIETTGFSAYDSSLYLIGTLHFSGEKVILDQFFADSFSSELPVLEAFFAFAKSFTTLVTFNGTTFDLPYIERCAEQYHLSSPLSELTNFDILKVIRKHKRLFNLEKYNQKSIEKFLLIDRKDIYSGGELIPVYESFVKSKSEEEKHLLLQHNEDDCLGMLKLLPILTYHDAATLIREKQLDPPEKMINQSATLLKLVHHFPFSFPREVSYRDDSHIQVICKDQRIEVILPLLRGELKYYYPDVRNYWYLPKEDYAIHKKLASFVAPEDKIPATNDTCYTRLSGLFVPSIPHSGLPECRESKESELSWHNLEIRNNDFLGDYLSCLFQNL